MTRFHRLAMLWIALGAASASVGGCRSRAEPAPSAVQARIVVSGRRYQVGFGADVRLEAEVEPSGGLPWTFSWTQAWGGPAANLVQDQGGKVSFRTCPAPSREIASAHVGGPVPLGAADACRVVLRVEARSGSTRIVEHVEVVPAFPTASWSRVPVGVESYWFLPDDEGWEVRTGTLEFAPGPVPWLGRARGGETQWIDLVHPRAGATRLRAGTWVGSQDCGRYDCHPSEYLGWQTTPHASVLERALRGTLPATHGPYRQDCLHCHALGYQPTASNDGFSERAGRTGWTIPEQLGARAWEELPLALKSRANVQCESCHGPGWFWVGYTNDVCAQCHDHPPQYLTARQARGNSMLDSDRRVVNAPKDHVCKSCHVGRSFLASLRGHESASKPGAELQTGTEGITCPTCHDPHARDCARQLRLCGPIETPGLTFAAGQGALCIACHTGDSDVFRGPLLRPFLPGRPDPSRKGHGGGSESDATFADAAPHAPQMQVLSGRGGRFLAMPERFTASPQYPHMWVGDSCVGCHFVRTGPESSHGGHTFRLADRAVASAELECPPRPRFERIRSSPTTAPCVSCHGPMPALDRAALGDYDGDRKVEGFVSEVDGLVGALRDELVKQFEARRPGAAREPVRGFMVADERIVYAAEGCRPLADDKGVPIPVPPTELLGKAAFNYLLVIRDGSAGIHNPKYVVKLLQNTLEALEMARGERTHRPWKREE